MSRSCAGSRGFDGAHDHALHELDLEIVVAVPARPFRSERRSAAKGRGIKTCSGERSFDPWNAPRLRADATERDTGLPDARPVHLERHGRRDDRELKRRPVAYLEIMRAPRH